MILKVKIDHLNIWIDWIDALVILLETIASTSSELLLSNEKNFESEEEMEGHHSFAVSFDFKKIYNFLWADSV